MGDRGNAVLLPLPVREATPPDPPVRDLSGLPAAGRGLLQDRVEQTMQKSMAPEAPVRDSRHRRTRNPSELGHPAVCQCLGHSRRDAHRYLCCCNRRLRVA